MKDIEIKIKHLSSKIKKHESTLKEMKKGGFDRDAVKFLLGEVNRLKRINSILEKQLPSDT